MSKESAPDRQAMTGRARRAFRRTVKNKLRKAEEFTSSLRRTHYRLLIASIMSSAATTLVAGITAAQGPIVGEGIPGWRITCIVAAVFDFATTVFTGLSQQLKIDDRLSEGYQCVGRLRSLDLTIATGSQRWEEIISEYSEIAKSYPETLSSHM